MSKARVKKLFPSACFPLNNVALINVTDHITYTLDKYVIN